MRCGQVGRFFFVATARAGRTAQGGDRDGAAARRCSPAWIRCSSRNAPQQGAGARPAPIVAVGCALAGQGPRPRCRATARQRQGAQSAPDPAAHDEQGGGLPHQRAPLCAPKGRFPEVAPAADDGLQCGSWIDRGTVDLDVERVSQTAGITVPEVVGRRAGRGSGRFSRGRSRAAGRRRGRPGRGRTPRRGGSPRVGQGLGELVAPVLVLGLQGPELGQDRGPPRRPGPRPSRTPRRNGDAGGAALPEAAMPFSGGEGQPTPIVTPLRNGAPAAPSMGPLDPGRP